MDTTPISLILRLRRAQDRSAWDRFIRLFAPLLDRWARRLCPQSADAEDLVQEVFRILLRRLPEFSYDPERSFRSWLWTVTQNTWHHRTRKPVPSPRQNEHLDQQTTESADLMDEEEYRVYLVGRAVKLMRSDFEERTWRACWELVVNGRPAAEVAAELGMSVNAVYIARSRVLTRLRTELAGLVE